MARHLLLTRPEHDYATRYLSAWTERFFKLVNDKGYLIIDLRRERANQKEFESILNKRSPDLVVVNGHGDDNLVTGHDNKPLIRAGANTKLLQGKITYAISCRSARILGQEVGTYSDTAYIGFQEDFILIYLAKYRTRPLEDDLAGLFLEPSNLVTTTLIKGNSVKEAVVRAKQEFLRNIQKLLTSKTKSDDSSVLRYLVWDMQNLVFHGEGDKKLS